MQCSLTAKFSVFYGLKISFSRRKELDKFCLLKYCATVTDISLMLNDEKKICADLMKRAF